ncbi:hypothetical protein [Paraburkholderia sp. WP4_3_2]|uniref:hypothetical protein n=1 Tax=Paraburkholderia sp. WP4_3_2 TaxID=2587162 RepID=UPI001607AAE0|nr:hypothetical protein [Paraburkholderia sp. WP4_3_2]MBB3256886.1 hypothetical protein [Paraburkholderia sp. WP4_3_2]
MQPVKIEVNLPMPAAMNKRWSNGRFITERVKQQIRMVVFGFRRCSTRDALGNEYIVHVLARVPRSYATFVRRSQWVSADLAWLDALVALNESALRPFLISGKYEDLAEVLA